MAKPPKKPVTVCLCLGGNSIACQNKDCPCPLHFASWKEYQKKREKHRVTGE